MFEVCLKKIESEIEKKTKSEKKIANTELEIAEKVKKFVSVEVIIIFGISSAIAFQIISTNHYNNTVCSI